MISPRTATQSLAFLVDSTWAAARVKADTLATSTVPGVLQIFSPPLTISGTSLASVAAGSNDADHTYLATKIAAFQPAGEIKIRLGWEMNGNFFPWYAVGNETNYINAFRRVVGLYRAVSSRFVFSFCPNQTENDGGGGFRNPETMYPGDAYVDIVAMDAYYDTTYDSTDSQTAFNYKKDAPFGLSWQCDFARKHQKRIAMDEWGITTNGKETYVSLMAQWFRTQGYEYHNYWDSNDGHACQLSNNQYPTTAARFALEFSKTF